MSVYVKPFGALQNGREVPLYTLENANGFSVSVTPYGCRIVSILAPDRDGHASNVLHGFSCVEDYAKFRNFHGSLVGRFANRIGNACFDVDGKSYSLLKNEGENAIHGGGPGNFSAVVFETGHVSDTAEPAVTFTHLDPDGTEGYPGNLTVTVTYQVTADNALHITYTAESDQKTPVNLTNHSYFNLQDDIQQPVSDTVLQIASHQVTEVDDGLIPTGTILDITGGPLDFTTPKPIGRDIDADEPSIRRVEGYDHNYVLDGEGLRKVAEAYEPISGRVMETFTDLPGMQLYTDNGNEHRAFCLETQFYPDAVHHPEFPFQWVEPDHPLKTTTIYRFSVR